MASKFGDQEAIRWEKAVRREVGVSKRYRVELRYVVPTDEKTTVEVDAADEAEAIDLAWEKLDEYDYDAVEAKILDVSPLKHDEDKSETVDLFARLSNQEE